MTQKKNVFVSPNKEKGGWDVKREGADRVSKHFETKEPAKAMGKDMARKDKVEYIEQLKDGTIGPKNSYGKDSNPPKDKNR